MKKIILSTFSFILALSVNAQIEIYHGENEIDISGTTINVIIDEAIVHPTGELIWEEHFTVKNPEFPLACPKLDVISITATL